MSNIKLKNASGIEQVYNGVTKIKVPKADGSGNAEFNEGGIIPSGNINITDTNSTNVTNYATAQVVDANLVASNIKKDIQVLGITGTLETGDAITGATEITGNALNTLLKGDTVRIVSGESTITSEQSPTTLPTSTGRGCAFNNDGTRLAVAHYSSPYVLTYGIVTDHPNIYKANNLITDANSKYGYAKENISSGSSGTIVKVFG